MLLAFSGQGLGTINVMQGTVLHREVPPHNTAEMQPRNRSATKPCFKSWPGVPRRVIVSISGSLSDRRLLWVTVPVSVGDCVSLLCDSVGLVHVLLSATHQTPGQLQRGTNIQDLGQVLRGLVVALRMTAMVPDGH